jgi:hypothetical protein
MTRRHSYNAKRHEANTWIISLKSGWSDACAGCFCIYTMWDVGKCGHKSTNVGGKMWDVGAGASASCKCVWKHLLMSCLFVALQRLRKYIPHFTLISVVLALSTLSV